MGGNGEARTRSDTEACHKSPLRWELACLQSSGSKTSSWAAQHQLRFPSTLTGYVSQMRASSAVKPHPPALHGPSRELCTTARPWPARRKNNGECRADLSQKDETYWSLLMPSRLFKVFLPRIIVDFSALARHDAQRLAWQTGDRRRPSGLRPQGALTVDISFFQTRRLPRRDERFVIG